MSLGSISQTPQLYKPYDRYANRSLRVQKHLDFEKQFSKEELTITFGEPHMLSNDLYGKEEMMH